jgi:ERCC4-type nuclease
MPISVVIDTREQRPWCFDIWVAACLRRKLDWGDYALDGDEENFAIERKSIDDFAGTVGKGWKRFLREIERSRQMVIIVEGNFSDFMFLIDHLGRQIPPKHHAMVTPQFIRKRVSELTLMGIPVIFGHSPAIAGSIAQQILCDRAAELKQKEKKLKHEAQGIPSCNPRSAASALGA